jgi:hypothetical protein
MGGHFVMAKHKLIFVVLAGLTAASLEILFLPFLPLIRKVDRVYLKINKTL